MTHISRHSSHPEIDVGRRDCGLQPILLLLAAVGLIVSFATLLRAQTITEDGEARLRIMQGRLNALSSDISRTEQTCAIAITVCKQ